MTGALMMGAEICTCDGSFETEASLMSRVNTALGSVEAGKGIKFELASVTGTTGALLTVADHRRIPAGRVKRRWGLPRFLIKYRPSVNTWPSLEMRVVRVARSTTKLRESP